MPTNVRPMLATLVHQPFDRRGWLFEIKWDGCRAIREALLAALTFWRSGVYFLRTPIHATNVRGGPGPLSPRRGCC
jgi:hypothetical protein